MTHVNDVYNARNVEDVTGRPESYLVRRNTKKAKGNNE